MPPTETTAVPDAELARLEAEAARADAWHTVATWLFLACLLLATAVCGLSVVVAAGGTLSAP